MLHFSLKGELIDGDAFEYELQLEVKKLTNGQSKKDEANMRQHQKLITKILCTFYLLLLIWIILMKTEFSFDQIYRMRSTNFIPLEGTAVYNNQLHYQEIYLNILIFVPFGIYLSILKPSWSFIQRIIPIFLVSLSFESLQYIFSIGATDITDLIGNTLGGVIGVLFYFLIYKLFKCKVKANHFMNLFAAISTLVIILLIVCFY